MSFNKEKDNDADRRTTEGTGGGRPVGDPAPGALSFGAAQAGAFAKALTGTSDTDASEGTRPDPCIVTEPILAWRLWQLREDQDGWRLCSTVMGSLMDTAWEGPVETAHEVPTWDNQIGLHSIKLPINLLHGLYPIHGIVSVYGRVIEHQEGYRSEKMILRKLFGFSEVHIGLPTRYPDEVFKDLENRYQVDVDVMPIRQHPTDWSHLGVPVEIPSQNEILAELGSLVSALNSYTVRHQAPQLGLGQLGQVPAQQAQQFGPAPFGLAQQLMAGLLQGMKAGQIITVPKAP